MDAQRIPGLALGIVEGDEIVHLRGFGESDSSGQAVSPETPFIIGSVAKSVTALAVMQLVEAGKVDLDAPVQDYLPWFRVADEKASAEITVRHLLNHTSGISTKTGRSYQGNGDTSDEALEKAVRKLSTAELTEPVGETFQYSTINYSVLGLIVQTVSGQSYESYIQDNVFDPLEMDGSFTSEADATGPGDRPQLLVQPAESLPRAVQPRHPPRRLPDLQRRGHGSLRDRAAQRRRLRRGVGAFAGGDRRAAEAGRPDARGRRLLRHGLVRRPGERHPGGLPPGRDVHLPLERRPHARERAGRRRADERGELAGSLRPRAHGHRRRGRREPARGQGARASPVGRRHLHRLRRAVRRPRTADQRDGPLDLGAASPARPRPAGSDGSRASAWPW